MIPPTKDTSPYRARDPLISAYLDGTLSTVASLASLVDVYLSNRSASTSNHLATQMHRSAMEALASLSNGSELAASTRLREVERGLGALYELELYTRMALQDPAGPDERLLALTTLTQACIDNLRSLLRLLPENVC